jgi:uncharacterized sulfatase
MKKIIVSLLAAGCLGVFASEKPNVVFIISDDQAWTDYSFMGHEAIQTPRLDRLARESLTFRRGYDTCSLCSPSLASVITGHFPHETKFTGNEPPMPKGDAKSRYQHPAFLADLAKLNASLDALPRIPAELAKAGYVSLQTGKWWGGSFTNGGFTEGMSQGDPSHGGRHGDEGLKIGRETLQPIFDFIGRAGDRPFMVWYAPMLPHQPHNPPEKYLAKYRGKTPSLHVAKYWAMCEWFDDTCGQLIDFLEAKKLRENTIIVYLSDNGWVQSPDKPVFAPESKNAPYDNGLRTPIMVSWPKKIAPRFDDTRVSAVDLAPTIYAACGVPVPAGMPGINLLDADAVKKRTAIFGSCGLHNAVDIDKPGKNTTYRWCVSGGFKFIVPNPETVKEPLIAGHKIAAELYDLEKDPHERDEISASNPEKVAELRKLLDGWWDGGGK